MLTVRSSAAQGIKDHIRTITLSHIYIHDLASVSSKLVSNMLADDSSFVLNGDSPSKLINTANEELKGLVKWLSINKLSLNLNKCKYILFSRKGTTSISKDKLCINNFEIGHVSQVKFWGYIIDQKLSWKEHVSYISLKISKNILPLNCLYVDNMLIYIFKVRNGRLPEPFTTDFVNYQAVRNTRQNFLYHVPNYSPKYLENTANGESLASRHLMPIGQFI